MPEWDLFLRKPSRNLIPDSALLPWTAPTLQRRFAVGGKKALQASWLVMGILASTVVLKGYQRPMEDGYFDATLSSLDVSGRAWSDTSSPLSPEEGFMQLVSQSFPSGFQTYEIQRWDTLEKIARQFGTSIDGLFYMNRVPKAIIEWTEKKPIIRTGRMIIIPVNYHELESSKSFLRAAYLKSVDRGSYTSQFTSFFPSAQSHLWWDTVLAGYKKTYESQLLAWQRLGYIEYAHIPWTPQISDYENLRIHGENIGDSRLPRALDIRQQGDVNCAWALRAIMRQSIDPNRIPKEWQAFFTEQNIDAWRFWARLMDLGFQQTNADLMSFFDQSRLTSYNPLQKDKQSEYYEHVNAMYASLPQYWPGVIIPKFFKFSRYKSHMAAEARLRKSQWASQHYNTHQTVYVGESQFSLRWADVPRLPNSRVKSGDRSVDIWLTDYIITRLDFGGSRVSTQVYQETHQSLIAMAPLVTLTVGSGEKTTLKDLIAAWDLPMIGDTTIVRVGWPLLLDGEHQDVSQILGQEPIRDYQSERDNKMTIRMRFAWEYGMYFPTEALVPPKNSSDFPLFWADHWILSREPALTIGGVYDIRKAGKKQQASLPYPQEYPESCDMYERVPSDENLYDGMWKYFCRSNEFRQFQSAERAKRHFDQSVYPAQLQALQMLGILPYGEQRAQIVANRVIPFVSTHPQELRQIYQRFVANTMEQWQYTNAQLPISQTYVGVYSLPGVSDTWERIITHIASYLGKTPGGNILAQRISQLDHASRRQFMETLMTLEEWTTEQKQELFGQKTTSGTLLVFHRELIRDALDRIERASASTHYDPVLHKVIHLISQDERIREIIVRIARAENTQYRDTATCLNEESFSTSYRCFLSRETVKRYLQEIDNSVIGSVRGKYTTSSLWDLQIRFDLLEQWSKKPEANWSDLVWPTREVLRQAVAHARRAETMGLRETLHIDDMHTYDTDMAHLDAIASILETQNPSSDQRRDLYRNFRQLIRLTQYSTDGIVGVMMSVPLLEDKIRGHIVHLSGVFRVLGRSPELTDTLGNTLPWRPSYTDYERMIVMINNQWETNVMYFMAQLYLQKLYSTLTWGQYEYPSIAGTTLKRELLGQTEYDPSIARKHMEGILSMLNSRAEFAQKYPELLRSEASPQGLPPVSEDEDYLREMLTRILQTRSLQDGIYALMRDVRLRSILTSHSMSETIIPLEKDLTEASARLHNEGFEREFLHYAYKGEMR